ncbi:MAG: DUF6259 domain-containing protein [Actinobacteria bacterium]|nr:DUF6259 domain-containing protein [Actinomycetota bacterium]
MSPSVTISSQSLRATFASDNGSLIQLQATDDSWSILNDPVLGLGFSLLLPLDDRRNNVADSRDQTMPSWQIGPDSTWAIAHWPSLMSQHGGVHDISISMRISAVDERLVFSLEIENRSEHVIEDVRFPRIGDVGQRVESLPLYSVMPGYADARRRAFRPIFTDSVPYFGVDWPTYINDPMAQSATTPYSPFVLIEDGQRGLYMAIDERSSEVIGWISELRPGYSDSMHLKVPIGNIEAPEPTSIRLEAAHVPYLKPGESVRLPDVALVAFQGGWQSGAELYRARRSTWTKPATPPAWASEPDAWLQLQVNSPEDELRLPFHHLPEVARSCVEHGVRTIQLVGWNEGGQDRNNPNHTPDSRLGGADALREAIAECQRHGVRVVLFAKFTWADRTTDRYRNELACLAITDPYGDPYVFAGFKYNTVSQMLGISPRPLVPMCLADERYREICEEDAARIVDLGADGMLFDECLHHGPALLCFNTSHGHRFGQSAFTYDMELVNAFARYSSNKNAEFLFAGEACYDGQFEVYHLSYHRSYEEEHLPLTRLLHPAAPLMTAITGFDERNIIGQALLRRYVMSYEPYHFKGRLEDFPRTTRYGRAMDALRREWREWFWDGTYRDESGATVTDERGKRHFPYAVYSPVSGGHDGVAIANHGDTPTVLQLRIDDSNEPLAIHLIDGSEWLTCDMTAMGAWVEMPPQSAGIVLPLRVVENAKQDRALRGN